jgi:hypothetical protein
MPTGGDPLKVDVNAQYAGVEWNYTYIVFCGFIVWLIIPGIGLLYSGLARRKSALALLFQSLMVVAVYVRPLNFEPLPISTSIDLTDTKDQDNLSMDLLGLLTGLCARCKPVHRHLEELRLEGCDGSAIAWFS